MWVRISTSPLLAEPTADVRSRLAALRRTHALLKRLQGFLAHNKTTTPLGLFQDPQHRPTVGSWGVSFVLQVRCPCTRNTFEPELNLEFHFVFELVPLRPDIWAKRSPVALQGNLTYKETHRPRTLP